MSKSDDEDFRRNRRRHQNREAARRCRQRKRDLSSNLLKEYQGLQSTNTQLIHEIRVLEKQKQNLDDCLGRHTDSCRGGTAIYRGLPKYLSPADAANRFGGESSSTTATGSGSTTFPLTTEATGQQETSKTSGTAGLTLNSAANGLNPSFRMSSTTLSFAPVKNLLRRDRSPLRRSSWFGRVRLTKDEGLDHRVPIACEPTRIMQDTVANGSTAAESLCFAFNDGDDDVISGDSNLSTLSIGPWLKDA